MIPRKIYAVYSIIWWLVTYMGVVLLSHNMTNYGFTYFEIAVVVLTLCGAVALTFVLKRSGQAASEIEKSTQYRVEEYILFSGIYRTPVLLNLVVIGYILGKGQAYDGLILGFSASVICIVSAGLIGLSLSEIASFQEPQGKLHYKTDDRS